MALLSLQQSLSCQQLDEIAYTLSLSPTQFSRSYENCTEIFEDMELLTEKVTLTCIQIQNTLQLMHNRLTWHTAYIWKRMRYNS